MCLTNASLSKKPTVSIRSPASGECYEGHKMSTFHKCIIWSGIILLTLMYLGLRHFMHASPYAMPALEYCPSLEPCHRPDLLAFQITSAIMLTYAGIMGLSVWHITKKCHQLRTPHARLFGHLPEADQINIATITFQIFDFIISTTIKEHASPIFLVHHTLAALISILSLKYQMAPYYASKFNLVLFSRIYSILAPFEVDCEINEICTLLFSFLCRLQ
mmetsp:Transcript_28414/g.65001  ORF Transcript_28414/g.65001 Transcript_28414/m.65001 type:complete len:218 (-) Transcript_28414:529-1182(-)